MLAGLIKKTALQLSPLMLLGVAVVFMSDDFFRTVYLAEIDSAFKLVFAVYLFGSMFSNVLTAWGRYVQVITNSLVHSFWLNIYMVLVIAVSVVVNYFLLISIPIPVAIGFGLVTAAMYYWYWLSRLNLKEV